MSSYRNHGTFTAAGNGAATKVRGDATLSAHFDSGSATITWEFKGDDGVWRTIYGGSDYVTAMAFTANHMVNVYFGNDVEVRPVASSVSSPEVDWQVMGNVANRHS